MVTLRRDVAAMQENNIFDRLDRDQSQITEYDRFMQEKNKSDNFSYIYSRDYFASTEEKNDVIKQEVVEKPKTYKTINEVKKETTFQNYNEYMISQLNRIVPGEILSEDDFNKNISAKRNKSDRKKHELCKSEKLSKRAKIVIGLYIAILVGAAILFFFI